MCSVVFYEGFGHVPDSRWPASTLPLRAWSPPIDGYTWALTHLTPHTLFLREGQYLPTYLPSYIHTHTVRVTSPQPFMAFPPSSHFLPFTFLGRTLLFLLAIRTHELPEAPRITSSRKMRKKEKKKTWKDWKRNRKEGRRKKQKD